MDPSGLICVFLAYIGAFFSQFFFYNTSQFLAWNAQARAMGKEPPHDIVPDTKRGNIAMTIGIAACFLSLIAFIAGSITALNALA